MVLHLPCPPLTGANYFPQNVLINANFNPIYRFPLYTVLYFSPLRGMVNGGLTLHEYSTSVVGALVHFDIEYITGPQSTPWKEIL